MTVDVVVWKQAMRKHPGMLTARESHVALGLTLWMNKQGNCNPSLTTIGNAVGASADTIRRGVYELVNKGWLEVSHRDGKPSLLQAAIPPDLDVDTYEIIAQPPSDPLHEREGSLPTTPSTSARGEGKPLAPTRGVTPGTGATPSKYGPDPLHPRDPNSSNSIRTTSNSSVLRGRAREEAEGENGITPESRPDLWARAQQTTSNTPGIKNPTAYRLAVFKRLIAEEEAQDRAALHDAEVDDCPHCDSAGFLLKTEDGYQVAYRCSHQGVPT